MEGSDRDGQHLCGNLEAIVLVAGLAGECLLLLLTVDSGGINLVIAFVLEMLKDLLCLVNGCDSG